MAITDNVNTKLLNDCFELQTFHGLCKAHELDVLQPPAAEEEAAAAENDDDDDVVVSNGEQSKSNVNSKSQLNSKISFEADAVPEIKHKLSDAGVNLQS